jgi:hypothetical protein
MGKGREEKLVRSESVSYSMLNFCSYCHQFIPTFMALKSMIGRDREVKTNKKNKKNNCHNEGYATVKG